MNIFRHLKNSLKTFQRRRISWLYALTLSVLLSACAGNPPADTRVQYKNHSASAAIFLPAIEKNQVWIKSLMTQKNIPGLAVSVSYKGNIVWSEAFGYADLENQVPVTRQTKFRIASISKTVTTTALAQLVEQGKLDLDKPVQTYVPEFPQKRWPITTRQLAGHLAGIRHYKGNEMASNRFYPTVNEGLEIFKNDPLEFEPGTQYSYSSYGWNLISAVIEGASGEPFLNYMKKNVFEKLHLPTMTAEYQHNIIPNRARFYTYQTDGSLRNAPCVDNSYKWAGGGFISAIDDLTIFGNAWLYQDFVSEETKQQFYKSQKTKDGKLTNYGMGFRSGTDKNGFHWIGHSGGAMGGRSMLMIYPEQELVVAFMINSTPKQVPAVGTGEKIAAEFLRILN